MGRLDKVIPKVSNGWHITVTKASAAGSEAKLRGKATYQALKGDLRAPEPTNHRKRTVALAIGAAAGAAFLAARRRRQPEWMIADITPDTELTKPDLMSVGDRGGASVDEMIADTAEATSSAVRKATEAAQRTAGSFSTPMSTRPR